MNLVLSQWFSLIAHEKLLDSSMSGLLQAKISRLLVFR
jgi:hypothetical protein